jgi:hypothetical protein
VATDGETASFLRQANGKNLAIHVLPVSEKFM